MIHSIMLINRQGKIRLIKWYSTFQVADRTKYMREIAVMVIGRSSRLSNFLEYGQYKIIYKRYASLYFITLCDKDDNELIVLEIIHHFVEVLDRYFGSVCELDIIFNFHKAYYIIEEILAGDTIKKDYLRKICEGLMLCVGTYQIPSADTTATVPQISGTAFFFDTKLLLRYIGCAGEAAVAAAQELVDLIQNAGGKIYYYGRL